MIEYKKKITIFFLLFLIIDIVIIVFLIIPVSSDIKIYSAEYISKKKELANLKAEISNFEDFEENYQIYLDELEEMKELVSEQILVDQELPLNFIDFLKKEAIKNRLVLEIKPIQLAEEKGFFKDTSFRLNIEGGFPGFLTFFKTLENSKWLINIQDLLISKEERKGTIKATLNMRIYVQDESEKENKD